MSLQKCYLDTSVVSLLDDDRAADRRDLTREFWDRRSLLTLYVSEVTLREIRDTLDENRRNQMLARTTGLTVLTVTPEAERLADEYLLAAAFPRSVPDDALHVAVAVLNRMDVIISWNFEHLVNQRRRAEIITINHRLGLPGIAIISPPEV